MRFWGSSAVVPLCVTEPRSTGARALLAADFSVAVWWATRTECLSALTRRVRDREMAAAGYRAVRRVLEALAETWSNSSRANRSGPRPSGSWRCTR